MIANSESQPTGLFIDGDWQPAASSRDIYSAHSEEYFATAGLADEAQMNRAVDAARRAFDRGPWPRMAPGERAGFLRRIADLLDAQADPFCDAWAHEVGVPIRYSRLYHPSNADTFRRYADMAATFPFREQHAPTIGSGTGLLVREPVGVVAAVVPWNASLMLTCIKLAPALLAGCTIVLKCASESPVEAMLFAGICARAGLPAGVVNVVAADREVSELLIRNSGIDKVSFTGSSATGRRIAGICAQRLARCTLELGGKSAALLLDDYDVDTVAHSMREAVIPMTGQACSLPSRLIVSRGRHDAMVEALSAAFASVKIGDPFDDATEMGPLANRKHLDRVTDYVALGQAGGAQLVSGGGKPADIDRGWFIEPAVFADVAPDMRIAQEEIFGPVVVVIPADDADHAVRIANDTIFGLNSVIYTNDADRALDVAGRLRSGNVGHNSYWVDTNIAFGGYKQSGIGREGGREGLLPFLEAKTILLDTQPQAIDMLQSGRDRE